MTKGIVDAKAELSLSLIIIELTPRTMCVDNTVFLGNAFVQPLNDVLMPHCRFIIRYII